MSWDQLELELAEMFDEYTWRADDRQLALERWGAWRMSDEKLEARRAVGRKSKRKQYVIKRKDPQWVAKERARYRAFYKRKYTSDAEYREKKRAKSREYMRAKRLSMGMRPRQLEQSK